MTRDEGCPTARDIAVGAGRICRWGGAVWQPLLSHLVLTGLLAKRYGGSQDDVLWALLHDAHETVTSDVPKPFKPVQLKTDQGLIDERLKARFSISSVNSTLIHLMDGVAADLEATVLKVPGYAEIKNSHQYLYAEDRAGIWSVPQDMSLAYNVLDSQFFWGTTEGPTACGVFNFMTALELLERGHKAKAMARVAEWMEEMS